MSSGVQLSGATGPIGPKTAQADSSREAYLFFAIALACRLAVAAWASAKFPPIDDGRFYHVVAERIAQGLGYTWAWPDGAVTFAAHYPIGYPALLGAAYWALGPSAPVAMGVNAVVGSLGVFCVQRLLAREAGPRVARLGALVMAFHPSLLFYTAALMTEGVVAALLAALAWLSVAGQGGKRPWLWLAAFGLLGGVVTLMRPQNLLLVAAFAFIAANRDSLRARLWKASAGTVIALCVCLPWTLRNCAQLERCVLVSANGGWNLLIGTAAEGHGGWVSLDAIGVPENCKTVFQEAHKDDCFREAGLERIVAHPFKWLALVPSKLGNTFNFGTPAAYYLGASNGELFSPSARSWLGGFELLSTRLITGSALLGAARSGRPTGRLRRVLRGVGLLGLLTPWAWVSSVCLALLGCLGVSPVARLAGVTVGLTAVTHAVFFGASRYALVCLPLVIAAGALILQRRGAGQDLPDLSLGAGRAL